METQRTKGKGVCKDAGSRIMKALTEGRPGDAEKVLNGFIEAGSLFEAESAAQEISHAQGIDRKLTVEELRRIAEVCRQKAKEGDEHADEVAEVALQKAENAEIND